MILAGSSASLMLALPTILAAGFASASMLLWAGAATIPLIIHLLTRRRQQKRPWAAMELLKQVVEEESKRVRFEQLLLLILRCLILLMLAIALAAPFLAGDPGSATLKNSNQTTLWIIGVDTSYSMGYRSKDDATRLRKAKDLVSEVLQDAQPGDSFALIELSSPSRVIIRRPTYNRDKMIAQVRELQCIDLPADAFSAVAAINNVLDDSESIADRSQIVIVSDFGTDSWSLDESGNTTLREELDRLDERAPCRYLSVVSGASQNVAITQLKTDRQACLVNQPTNVAVGVQCFGYSEPVSVDLEVLVDDQLVETQELDLSEGSASTFAFSFIPKSLGQHVITARIPSDGLIADNDRNLVIDVRSQYRILCLEERPDDARLIRYSLAPPQASFEKNANLFVPSAVRPGKLGEITTLDLSKWDAIAINDIAYLDQRIVNQLEQYVNRGGKLVVYFGSKTKADSWNRLLGESDLLGFRLVEPSVEDEWAIDPLDYTSPVAKPFEGFPDSGLLTTPIFRHWTIEQLSSNAKLDLGIVNSGPLLVRNKVGAGWVGSFLTAPEDAGGDGFQGESWNALSSWPSFVPLNQQLFQVLLDSELDSFNAQCGELISGVTTASTSEELTLFLEDGSKRQLISELNPDQVYGWDFNETSRHGVLVVKESERSLNYAINLNPIESSLQSLSPNAFPQSTRSAPTDSDTEELDNSGNRFSFLTRLSLVLLLVLLVAESLAARLIGRRVG